MTLYRSVHFLVSSSSILFIRYMYIWVTCSNECKEQNHKCLPSQFLWIIKYASWILHPLTILVSLHCLSLLCCCWLLAACNAVGLLFTMFDASGLHWWRRYGRRAVFLVGISTTVFGRLVSAFTTSNLYLFRGTSLIGICGITAMYLSPYIIGMEISKPYAIYAFLAFYVHFACYAPTEIDFQRIDMDYIGRSWGSFMTSRGYFPVGCRLRIVIKNVSISFKWNSVHDE